MSFLGQVGALVRKDFHVVRANKKSSTVEFIFVIFCSCMAGLFILLSSIVGNALSNLNIPSTPAANVFFYSTALGAAPLVANTPLSAPLTAMWNKEASELALTHDIGAYVYNSSSVMFETFDTVFANNPNYTNSQFIAIVENAIGNWTLVTNLNDGIRTTVSKLVTDWFVQFGSVVKYYIPTNALVAVLNFPALFATSGVTFMIDGLLPALILTSGRLVAEKKGRVRESLRVMGVSDAAYLGGSFVSAFIRMGIPTLLASFILAAFKAITVASIPLTLGITLVFAMSFITFAQLMPSLFSNPMWGNLLCIIFTVGSGALAPIATAFPLGLQYLVCLLSPVAFFMALMPEMAHGSVQLPMPQSHAVLMMFVDGVLHLLLAEYIHAVAPGEFGVPKHPLWFLPWNKTQAPRRGSLAPAVAGKSPAVIEEELRVEIDNLVKVYGNNTDQPAVDHLSLGIRRGEIFALLGHNGAGKTTTLSMLTGMTTATSYGIATIDGLDITAGMDEIRRNIGLCPQFDVLFGDLTARQHLELFAALKGGSRTDPYIDRLLEELELTDRVKAASKFSGGMKRRLSVGNALVGKATLVLLDEPSSGLDPLNRRRMWNLLKNERDAGRTIVLTTHFMEEADYLANRIAIMSHGRLYCCDTSQRLKETYGIGFYLTLVKAGTEASDVAGMHALLQKHVPETTLSAQTAGDVTFQLPSRAIRAFEAMLREVETQLARMGFHSYGVSANTLEDVFVSISKAEEKKREEAKPHGNEPKGPANATTIVNGRPVQELFAAGRQVPQSAREGYHMKLVLRHKMRLLLRNRRLQMFGIFFPLIVILIGFAVMQPQPAKKIGQSFLDGKENVDFTSFQPVFVDLLNNAASAQLRAMSQSIFYEQHPQGSMEWLVATSTDQYNQGGYIPTKKLVFAGTISAPPIPCGIILNGMTALSAASPQLNYTLLTAGHYFHSVGAICGSLINSAAERLAGNNATFLTVTCDVLHGNSSSGSSDDAPTPPPASGSERYQMTTVGIYFIIGLVQLLANSAIPALDEINRGVVHVLRVHGLSGIAFYVGNILFDLLFSMYPVLLLVVGFFVRGVGGLEGVVLLWVVLAAILLAIHTVLHCYILATRFPTMKPASYTAALQALTLAQFVLPYAALLAINAITKGGSFDVNHIKPFLLAITPAAHFYHLLDNASDLTKDDTHSSYLMTFDTSNGVGGAYGFLIVIAELALPLLILRSLIAGPSRRTLGSAGGYGASTITAATPLLNSESSNGVVEGSPVPDVDVEAEERRVLSTPPGSEGMTNSIEVRKLLKTFGVGDTKKNAVNHTTFGVRRKECFGLLGPNGAGKTTTCKLVLQELYEDGGEIRYTYAPQIRQGMPKDEQFVHAALGTCPQNDTLWENFDHREHLDFYLAARLTTAYVAADWQAYIEATVAKVQLEEAGSKWAGAYSGGMKRKLQVALAMYTGANVTFLDEPSTGMDPFARRALWQVILEALREDRTVLLTTHSMEEADAVCGRIAIMTAGELRCIGSGQHLKNRFGSGYVVTLTLDEEGLKDIEALDAAVQGEFPGARLQEGVGMQRRYAVGNLPSLAAAFGALERKAAAWHVTQYSVAQTSSLEQIFLNFVGPEALGEPAS